MSLPRLFEYRFPCKYSEGYSDRLYAQNFFIQQCPEFMNSPSIVQVFLYCYTVYVICIHIGWSFKFSEYRSITP